MTARDLFEQLLAKGYQPPKCGDHHDGVYCCAKDVYDKWETFPDASEAERLLKNYLELDRREVFYVWYRDSDENPFTKLDQAHEQYLHGNLTTSVDYLLQNP